MRRDILASGFVTAFAVCGAAQAADGRFELRSDLSVARDDPFAADDELIVGGVSPFALETGLDSNTWLRRVQPLGDGQVLRVEGQLRVRTYFDRDELNSVLLTPRVQYWKTSTDNRVQVRLSAAYGALQRDGDAQWTRPEGEAQLRVRPKGDRTLETVFRVRATAYDFDRPALQGLDSGRVRAGVEQFIRPDDRGLEIRAAAYVETADADDPAFSFDEVRVQAGVTFALDPQTTLSVLADFRDRDYEAPNTAALMTEPRADERLELSARAERRINERLTAFAAAGYLDNQSNWAARDYDGATFRAGFSLRL